MPILRYSDFFFDKMPNHCRSERYCGNYPKTLIGTQTGDCKMQEIIAERDLIGIKPDGSKFKIMLKIGKPYTVDGVTWTCSVGAIGLYKRLREISGIDSFQALMQAIKFLKQLIEYFIDDGGNLLSPDDETPVEISDIFT